MDDSWREGMDNSDRWHDGADGGEWEPSCPSFLDQLLSGSFPIRMPLAMEIYAEGVEIEVHRLDPGQKRRRADSHVIALELLLDRAKVCELMLEAFHEPRRPDESKLADLMALTRVDRACFLETAAAHFADLLAAVDGALRRDPWLAGYLRELHEYDAELIGEMVAATLQADRAAGARLRDVILDTLDEPHAREQIGWLAAAAIRERVQELG